MSEVKVEKKLDKTPAEIKVNPKHADWNQLAGIKKKTQNKWFNLAKKHLIHKQAGRWFLSLVVVPWSMVAVYYTSYASDRYISEASFMIEKNDGASSQINDLSLLGVTSKSGNDQRIVEAFIQSPDMLNYLDKQLNLKDHYSTQADLFSRLAPDASYEAFLEYYRAHLRVQYNDTNGMLDMELQGYTPEFALALSEHVLKRSEAFVNEISHNLAGEQLRFVQSEVALSESRLKDMTARLVEFQNQTGLLSAQEQGAALNTIMNELQAELVRNQAELQTMTSYLNSNSPKVVALKQRMAALEKQLSTEKTRLTDSSATSLNDLAARQQELQLDLELATKAYSSALVALEGARTEASRKLKQLVVISSPQLAEEAKYPRVGYALTNILLILLALFALVRMIRATIREHKD